MSLRSIRRRGSVCTTFVCESKSRQSINIVEMDACVIGQTCYYEIVFKSAGLSGRFSMSCIRLSAALLFK